MYSIVSVNRTTFDLSDAESTRNWFSDKHFDVIIHTAVMGGSRLSSDDISVLDNNLKMYYNLVDNRTHYDRFINIGSGAELYSRESVYGLSKYIIRQSLLPKDNFYNIRIFGIFNEKELETRFIKANIKRYISKEKMVIFQDKLMDFYYMEDFISLMKYYIETINVPKEYECCYPQQYHLSTIAKKINNLSDYTVPVEILDDATSPSNYIGVYVPLPISLKGIDVGINTIYQRLLCKE
jgi:nucleoside-diphosphate-sugar epimerase